MRSTCSPSTTPARRWCCSVSGSWCPKPISAPSASSGSAALSHSCSSSNRPDDPHRPQGGRPMLSLATIAVLAIFVVIILFSAVRILREYERGVVFTLGRYTGTKGPGFFLLVPLVQQMVRVDLRVIVDEVPTQDVISRDNVSVKVNAVIYFRVVDPERAVIQVYNYLAATSQLAQTTLRWVLGKHDLDQMLAERDKLNADIQDALDKQTEARGIKLSTVEIN